MRTQDEFSKRLAAAKQHRREEVEDEGREVYLYCETGRQIEWDRTKKKRRTADELVDEVFADAAGTVAEEFTGELFSTMTPENVPWVEYEAGNAVKEGQAEQARQDIEIFEGILAKSIRSSNYYDEGPIAFKDASVGNVALWVDRPGFGRPIECEAIPLPNLFLNLTGSKIDDRFRMERFPFRDLPAILPYADFPREVKEKIKKDQGTTDVIWGYWMDFSDPLNPIWRQEVRAGGKPCGMDQDIGEEGSCPIVVGRFNPYARSAWGRGPGRRMLPTMRTIDEIMRMNLEGMDRNLDPAHVYPHDGILDLSDGIEPGMGYPAMPGSSQSVMPIGMVGNLDFGMLSEERLKETLRDGFYRELEQRGKTPPSASQFIGQQNKQLRRMARPATKTWREFGVGLLKRFEHLEREPGGMLEGVEIPLLDDGVVIARPVSPLERAQAMEEVTVADSIMGMMSERMGPDQAAIQVNGPLTFRNIKEKLKDKMVEFRSEQEIGQIMQMMQQQQVPNEQ